MNYVMAAEASTSSSISDLLSILGSVVTQLISWVGDVFAVIAEHPIALIWVGVALGFTAVKFAKYILGM